MQETGQDAGDKISSRGFVASRSVNLPYKSALLEALKDPCHPIENKEGYVALCRAENKLIMDAMCKRLSRQSVAQTAFGTESTYCYDDVRGMKIAREAVAQFITKKFICTPNENDDGEVVDGSSASIVKLASVYSTIVKLCFSRHPGNTKVPFIFSASELSKLSSSFEVMEFPLL